MRGVERVVEKKSYYVYKPNISVMERKKSAMLERNGRRDGVGCKLTEICFRDPRFQKRKLQRYGLP